VLLEPVHGRAVGLEERGVTGAAAQAFEAHAPGPGEAVVHPRALDVWREDVEERLLHPVGDRPGDVARRGQELSAAKLAGDDAHRRQSSGGCARSARIAASNKDVIVADRSVHYEAAFQAYLRDTGVPCVAVDEAKKALFANAKLKSFDFVVYSKSGPNLLIDVKGRQMRNGSSRRGFETWTT